MSIKKELTKGVFWIAVAKYSGIAISLLVTAILARLISPSAFGTIAIAMVILHFLNVLSDIGIGVAIVQFKQLTKKNLNDIFTITVFVGIILCLLLFVSSELIANYYDDAVLKRVCELMSIVIFFHSLNIVPNGLMRKEKRFKTIALRTLFFQITSGSIAIWGAFHGWGIYALIVSPIATAVGVFCVNFYNYPQRISRRISKESVSVIMSYSVHQFMFSFCNYFSRNLDKLIIGKQFTMTQLGYYDKSYHLMMVPVQNIAYVIDPVLHPILSSLQNNKKELKDKNCKLARFVSNISFPIGLLLFFCGKEIINIVYGDRWDASIPVFKILALSLPFQIILSTINPIFQSAGDTRRMFYQGIFNTTITVSGLLFAVFCIGTIESVAWAWDITLLVNFFNSYFILHHFTLKEPSKDFIRVLMPQIANSAIVFLICFLGGAILPELNLIISLIIKTIVLFASTVILAQLFHQYSISDIFVTIRRKAQR